MLQETNVRSSSQFEVSRACGKSVIPEIFCWTKMGTEAGQSLSAILHRKEMERCSGGGTFAWGIGNSLGGSAELAKRMSSTGEVDVLFTPMKSPPKAIDQTPSELLLWQYYLDRSGSALPLPEHMLVTSRGGGDKRTHYALLCQSESPLEERYDQGSFDPSGVRNLASMNPVGASQVTSVVRYRGEPTTNDKSYRVAFKARLFADGFVKLVNPVVMNATMTALYEKVCNARSERDWVRGTQELNEIARTMNAKGSSKQGRLFQE